MKLIGTLSFLPLIVPTLSLGPLVRTTTGPILGLEVAPGVLAWKGIPFAVPPTGERRWTLPVLNKWSKTMNATTLGPACFQQEDNDGTDPLDPPLFEDEDCLTINLWAPSNSSQTPKAVLFWIYGGSFSTGGSGTPFFDGTLFAKNQDVIIVSHNYRTNVFGFPNSPELPLEKQNLGLFDQRLALSWTKENISKFGGDPTRITLFGQSSGSASAALLVEHFHENAPFHGAILQSGVVDALDNNASSDLVGNFTEWNSLATHFGCPSANGTAQIDCLKKVPARDLEQFIIDNSNSLIFLPQADGGVTVPDHPSQQLETGAVARVPIMIGDNASGGSFLTIGENNFTAFISQPPLNIPPAEELRALYPVPAMFATDAQAIVALATDIQFRCRSALFADILTNKSLSTVYRYVYGAVLSEAQIFPNAGTPEGSEQPLVFGNLNGTTNATEIALSKTLQTIWANFAKHPDQPPAPNWPEYTSTSKAVAELAFGGNVVLDNIVVVTNSSSLDRACQLLDTLPLF